MTVTPTVNMTVDGRVYPTIADGVHLRQAIIVGQAVEEFTGRQPLRRVSVTVTLAGQTAAATTQERRFAVSAGTGGAFAISAVVNLALPDLAVTAYTLDLVLTAPGYLETPVSVTIPAGTAVLPLPPLQVELRRPAILLRGRVLTAGAAPIPVNGAALTVTDPPGMLGFSAPLALTHLAAADVIRRNLAPQAPDLPLLEEIFPGTTELRLQRRDGLAPNRVLQIGTGPDREYAVVANLTGPLNLTLPGTVRLRAPLGVRRRGLSTFCRRVLPGAPLDQDVLQRDVFPGDQVIFTGPGLPLLANQTFQIGAAPAAVEYRIALPLNDSTNPDGYYRLGPINGASVITVHFAPPAAPARDLDYTLDYSNAVNVLDLRA